MQHYKIIRAHQLPMKEFYVAGAHVFRKEIKAKLTLNHIISSDMAVAQIVFSRDKSGGIAVIRTSISFYLGDGNPSIFISTLCPPHSKLRAFFVSG
jgi:hypothetical protein